MEQFARFFRQSEEQISMVILEAGANQLLYKGEEEEPRGGKRAIPFSSLNLPKISAATTAAAAYYPLLFCI